VGAISNMVLQDVTAFLRHRALEYFTGFLRLPVTSGSKLNGHFYQESKGFAGFARDHIPMLDERIGRFFSPSSFFGGFTHCAIRSFLIKRGAWV
jgi:hypothetical protein